MCIRDRNYASPPIAERGSGLSAGLLAGNKNGRFSHEHPVTEADHQGAALVLSVNRAPLVLDGVEAKHSRRLDAVVQALEVCIRANGRATVKFVASYICHRNQVPAGVQRDRRRLYRRTRARGSTSQSRDTNFPILDSICLLYTSPSPRDRTRSRMPSSA